MLYNAVLVSGKGVERGNPLVLLVECKSATVVAQMVRNLPAVWETWVRSLGWEDPLEEGMATHSSIAWRIPWTEEPSRPHSTGSQCWTRLND